MVPVSRHTLYSSRLLFLAPRPSLRAMPRVLPGAPPGRTEDALPPAAAAAAQRLSRGHVLAPPTGGRSAVFSTAATSNGAQASVSAGSLNTTHAHRAAQGAADLVPALSLKVPCPLQATAPRRSIGDTSCRHQRLSRSSTPRRSRCSPFRLTGQRHASPPERPPGVGSFGCLQSLVPTLVAVRASSAASTFEHSLGLA